MRRTLIILGTSALLVTLWGAPTTARAASAPAQAPATPSTTLSTHRTIPELENRVVVITNRVRQRNGCRPLRMKRPLRRAAGRHSARMAGDRLLSHRLPGEPWLVGRVEAAGYTGWTRLGENVASGYSAPRGVVRGWMRSATHRVNILDCRFRHIGVGLASSAGRRYWTQDFGRR